MIAEALWTLSRLIATQRVSSLGTLRNGSPHVSLVLYVPSPDYSTFFMLLSELAVHTGAILADPRVSLLIAEADQVDRDPQSLARVTLEGEAREIPRDTPEFEDGRSLYVERFPGSKMTFGLGGFRLFSLRPRYGRVVAGFAQAFNITTEDLKTASAL